MTIERRTLWSTQGETDGPSNERSDGMTSDALLAAIADAERGPSPTDLKNAPVLNRWWLMADGILLRAAGDLNGHPTIFDPFVTTSPVLGFDAGAGWMRTRSRWYKLGIPDDRHDAAIDDAAQRLLAAMRARARKAYDGIHSGERHAASG